MGVPGRLKRQEAPTDHSSVSCKGNDGGALMPQQEEHTSSDDSGGADCACRRGMRHAHSSSAQGGAGGNPDNYTEPFLRQNTYCNSAEVECMVHQCHHRHTRTLQAHTDRLDAGS